MKLIIASDFAGFRLKEAVLDHLKKAGHTVLDAGQKSADQGVSYIEAASGAARAFLGGGYDRAIVVCGSGAGVSVVANKFKGIYCVPCESVFTADKCAAINNANVLALGATVVGPENACRIVDAYLAQRFCGGFEPAREQFITGLFGQVREVEEKNFK